MTERTHTRKLMDVMEHSSPRVSVVMPAHNSAAYIEKALLSLHAQTIPAYEIIVVDDGSADDTAARAEALGARVLTQDNAGPAAARNAGIRACAGEWIAFFDADDLWEKRKLERQLEAVRRWPEVGMVFSDYRFFDERGTHRKTGFEVAAHVREVPVLSGNATERRCDRAGAGRQLLRGMFMQTSTVLVRREILLGDTLFDPDLRCAEDYELFLRLVMRTEIAYIDEPLVAYRRHASSITADLENDLRGREGLMRRCAEQPERYPPGAAAMFTREQARHVARGAALALRAGSFAVARERARKCLEMEGSPHTRAILIAASLCDNPMGRALHASLRRVWISRPGKYQDNTTERVSA